MTTREARQQYAVYEWDFNKDGSINGSFPMRSIGPFFPAAIFTLAGAFWIVTEEIDGAADSSLIIQTIYNASTVDNWTGLKPAPYSDVVSFNTGSLAGIAADLVVNIVGDGTVTKGKTQFYIPFTLAP